MSCAFKGKRLTLECKAGSWIATGPLKNRYLLFCSFLISNSPYQQEFFYAGTLIFQWQWRLRLIASVITVTLLVVSLLPMTRGQVHCLSSTRDQYALCASQWR